MQEVLARLDNPHLNLPPTIHVAGTNGKGSTIAFLRAMLESAGKTVHSYTTPHLVEFNERFNLAGKNISDEFLFEIMEEVRLKSETLRLGFFEATTAGAFLAFSRSEADYLLLETGMGGRLDATNIIPAPLLAIITTISKDHTEFLGEALPQIASEKLGIVKPGTICISSLQHEAVAETIENRCAALEIPLIAFSYDFAVDKTDNGFRYLYGDIAWELPNPSLIGDHQYINAAMAITAAVQLNLSKDHIIEGLQNTHWPSRLEKIKLPYVPENFEFYLDGAHNPAGAFALANHLDYWRDKPVYLIFGTTKGREVKDFINKFHGKIAHLALTKIKFEPASYEAEEMLPFAEAFPPARMIICRKQSHTSPKTSRPATSSPVAHYLCAAIFNINARFARSRAVRGLAFTSNNRV